MTIGQVSQLLTKSLYSLFSSVPIVLYSNTNTINGHGNYATRAAATATLMSNNNNNPYGTNGAGTVNLATLSRMPKVRTCPVPSPSPGECIFWTWHSFLPVQQLLNHRPQSIHLEFNHLWNLSVGHFLHDNLKLFFLVLSSLSISITIKQLDVDTTC